MSIIVPRTAAMIIVVMLFDELLDALVGVSLVAMTKMGSTDTFDINFNEGKVASTCSLK